jgi:hypothetical protein
VGKTNEDTQREADKRYYEEREKKKGFWRVGAPSWSINWDDIRKERLAAEAKANEDRQAEVRRKQELEERERIQNTRNPLEEYMQKYHADRMFEKPSEEEQMRKTYMNPPKEERFGVREGITTEHTHDFSPEMNKGHARLGGGYGSSQYNLANRVETPLNMYASRKIRSPLQGTLKRAMKVTGEQQGEI